MTKKHNLKKNGIINDYNKELRYKAGQFIRYLSQRSIYGKILTIYQYSVKIQIKKSYESYGQILIYYKPSKMQYKLVKVEIKNEKMQEYLQELWECMNDEAIRIVSKYVIKINL